MDLNKVYYDEEGNAKTILQMVKLYPEWAANRLQECEKAIESAMCEANSNAVLADVLAEIREGAWTDNNTGEKYVYIEQLKGFLGKYFINSSMMICPKCKQENSDNWPLKIEGEIIEGGCQECWESHCSEGWWKAVDKIEDVHAGIITKDVMEEKE